jgi:hypothetical protein
MQVGLTKFGYKLEKEVVVTLISKYGNFTQLFASKSSKIFQEGLSQYLFFSPPLAKWWKLPKKRTLARSQEKGVKVARSLYLNFSV